MTEKLPPSGVMFHLILGRSVPHLVYVAAKLETALRKALAVGSS